jgi:dTDP-4-amino-4,6-dideoxygalactose transaminase
MTISVKPSLGVPVMRPQLPTADQLAPYLRRIDETRYYSNHGPLLRELETRFAEFFAISADQLAVIANGTVGLSAALVATGARPGLKCLLPSWTFVGSAAAVWAANLRPHFVDVDPATWMLDPRAIARRNDLDEVGAIMVVSAFGAPVDTRAWDEVSAATGIPVIIDCAASFDTVARIGSARPGKSPIMISLHATKVFGVGEGAIVLSTERDLVRRFNKICNFGVWDSPEGQILGYNGKLSEYHAAVGLATLGNWERRRALAAQLTDRYVRRLRDLEGASTLPGYGEGWVSCYCNVAVDGDAAPVLENLAARGVETRRWWQHGVHVQNAYRDFTRDRLPVTESLARRVFGLPFFHDISDEEFEHVMASLEAALHATRRVVPARTA